MVVLVAFTIGLIFWVAAWSFDIKSFDAFLVTVLLTVAAAGYMIAKPFVDQLRGRSDEPADDPGAAY